ENAPRPLLTTLQALMQPVPDRAGLQASRRVLRTGEALDLEELSSWLLDHGYRRTEVVELPGEFSRRGGILDVFPPDVDDPFRVELFGEEIESIRQFNAGTQRSLGTRPAAEIMALFGKAAESASLRGHLCDYLPEGSWTV